ncbi:reverse transcriptase domain-containing protein [Rubinisphaera italica]|uniref:Group II intron-encoded protein LtrA n=1 Tax=Rubinisphaera italica TaxID=2527969 RepID=A0A5C5XMY0_9PLAN|nr:reverse transcriptase domain-containing protein [Rubinisphaera italica]TWT63723.1 Group II intron-encoded protein LtrA [Rubinisphaera italica]
MSAIRELQNYLFEQAKSYPTKPHADLFHFLSEWCVLQEAFRRARKSISNRGSGNHASEAVLRGRVDQANDFLQELGHSLLNGTYRPGKVRSYEIPKPGKPGESRRVAVLSGADKVVHHALKIVLDPVIEARLHRRSFAFRPGKTIWDQLHALRKTVDQDPLRFQCGLVIDIESFFDRIDHRRLLNDLGLLTNERPFTRLVKQLLNQVSASAVGLVTKRPAGILQGSPLSPLLANWHLDSFDRNWDRQFGKTNPLFRYADDIVTLTSSKEEANQIRKVLIRQLKESTQLSIAKKKTRITPLHEGLPILGMKLLRSHDPFLDENRTLIITDADRIQEAMQSAKEDIESFTADRPLGQQFEKLNRRLRGWFQTWQFASDASSAFESIDLSIYRLVRSRLKSCLKISHAVLNEQFSARADTGHPTWEADGVQILMLQSLPRNFYQARQNRFPWQDDAASPLSPVPPIRITDQSETKTNGKMVVVSDSHAVNQS